MKRSKGGIVGATTKRALKEAVQSNPEQVSFWSPNLFGSDFSGPVSRLTVGDALDVSGPDPQSYPTWYATITRRTNGKLVVL